MQTHFNHYNSMNYVEIAELVSREYFKLGTHAQVANKCQVSVATINQIHNERWNKVGDNMWRKVAAALDWRPNGWNIVETGNTKLLHKVFDDSKKMSLWMAVSSPAGSSKTTSAKSYSSMHSQHVYYLECERWHKSTFVRMLGRSIGLNVTSHKDADQVLFEIIKFFAKSADERPLLILDQVDKLHEAAMGLLIPIFNGLEDKMGCVIMGVGHLQKLIQNNVRKQNMGWDEIESRFGRTYIGTYGAIRQDVTRIAKGNGLNNKDMIEGIWKECQPETVVVGTQKITVVKDMRRLKRCIQNRLLVLGDMQGDISNKKEKPVPVFT